MKDKTIILDVDGVLLDFSKTMKDFWKKKYPNAIINDIHEYCPSSVFGFPKEEAHIFWKEFNEEVPYDSHEPVEGAVDAVNRLKELGYEIYIITKFGKKPEKMEARIRNLDFHFGEDAFEEVIFVETNEGKDSYLRNWENSGIFFVDDLEENCYGAIGMGLNPILFGQVWNRPSIDFPRYTDWETIIKHIETENGK